MASDRHQISINVVNRLAAIDSDNALDKDPAVLDHGAMVRGDQRSSFSVSMLRVYEDPRRKHSRRLIVVNIELAMPFDLSESSVALASETLESWLSHRRPPGRHSGRWFI